MLYLSIFPKCVFPSTFPQCLSYHQHHKKKKKPSEYPLPTYYTPFSFPLVIKSLTPASEGVKGRMGYVCVCVCLGISDHLYFVPSILTALTTTIVCLSFRRVRLVACSVKSIKRLLTMPPTVLSSSPLPLLPFPFLPLTSVLQRRPYLGVDLLRLDRLTTGWRKTHTGNNISVDREQ